MSTPYFYSKIRVAVATLAREEAPLRQRIVWAVTSIIGVPEDQVPSDVLPFMLELVAQTTWKQDGEPGDGLLERTVAAMGDEDARKVAELLVTMLVVTSRHVAPQDVLQDLP